LPTRTWLTTPPGDEPVVDQRAEGEDERYVPALRAPSEPRVPGKHRRALVITGLVVGAVLLVVSVVLIGEQAQQEDPSVPDIPGLEDPTLDEAEDGSLPE
jgi:hypothetical protein